MSSPDKFSKKLETLKFQWSNAKNQYKAAYPNYKLNIDRAARNRALSAAIGTYRDLQIFSANVDGTLDSTNNFLKSKDEQISKIKQNYNDNKVKLESKYGNNVASQPFKKDKFNEYSESLIFFSFYTISFFTSTYFIYKQLKK